MVECHFCFEPIPSVTAEKDGERHFHSKCWHEWEKLRELVEEEYRIKNG